jgi:hypothetical protein
MSRSLVWTLLIAAGFALVAPRQASAQEPIPTRPRGDISALTLYREQGSKAPAAEIKKAREMLKSFAQYYSDVIAHPLLWKSPQDIRAEIPPQFPFNALDGEKGVFKDMDRLLLVPEVNGKFTAEQADYVRDLGAELDKALSNLIQTNQEKVVRINACRALAHVARTGAPAHYETITPLVASPDTPPELKQYALQAAGALLSAIDATEPKVRKHSGDAKAVGALVKALEDCVNTPGLLVPGFKADTATGDQFVVVAFMRRQAVRALGNAKFATLPGPDGLAPLFPAYTLARVALGDETFVPLPGPAEAAEAVIGLCNMQPPPPKGAKYNADVAVEAVVAGLYRFAAPRATNPGDRTLPWRHYSIRLAEALRAWRGLFDPDFDPTQPNGYNAALVPPALADLYKEVLPKVLAPIERVDANGKPDATARVEVETVLRDRLRTMRASPNRSKTLFTGVPGTNVEFALAKKP